MILFFFRGRRLWLTLLVAIITVVFCRLGIWQYSRMNERLALIELERNRMNAAPIALDAATPIDPDAFDYRRVLVKGTFAPGYDLLLRNRSVDGATGFHIITPLKLDGSDKAVLVDRGWIPYDQAKPEQRAAFPPPTGEISFEAIVRRSQEATTTPVDPQLTNGQKRLDAWFRINIPRIQQQIDLPLLPVFIEQQPVEGQAETLPILRASVPDDPGNHMSYMIQWFAFALILLGGYGAITYQQWQQSLGIPQRTSDVARMPHSPS